MDVNHFYAVIWTIDNDGYCYSWLLLTDRWGNNGQGIPLTNPSDWEFGSIAVYPSILGTPGMSKPGGGGGGGGPQGAGLTNLLPRAFALSQSIPNPANEGLRIDYALPKESQVSLRVYNVMGHASQDAQGRERKAWILRGRMGREGPAWPKGRLWRIPLPDGGRGVQDDKEACSGAIAL